MKPAIFVLCGALAVALVPTAGAAPSASGALAPTTYATLAARARSAGHVRTALFFEEQALASNIGQPSVFDPASAHYWQSINQSGEWGRAYDFFARLKAEHPDDPDVLANYGSAVGGLFGMLTTTYGKKMPRGFYASLNRDALHAYAHALHIDPDNFTALLERSIYLSYAPHGMARAETGFKHLLSLRKSHPHYPYALVYREWTAALKRNGQPERATRVMREGKRLLGRAAFSNSSNTR